MDFSNYYFLILNLITLISITIYLFINLNKEIDPSCDKYLLKMFLIYIIITTISNIGINVANILYMSNMEENMEYYRGSYYLPYIIFIIFLRLLIIISQIYFVFNLDKIVLYNQTHLKLGKSAIGIFLFLFLVETVVPFGISNLGFIIFYIVTLVKLRQNKKIFPGNKIFLKPFMIGFLIHFILSQILSIVSVIITIFVSYRYYRYMDGIETYILINYTVLIILNLIGLIFLSKGVVYSTKTPIQGGKFRSIYGGGQQNSLYGKSTLNKSQPHFKTYIPESKDALNTGSNICPNCGILLESGVKFCPKCGNKI